MKNTKYWLSLALVGWAGHAFAQTEIDALRYSQLQFGGGARTLGIGGANTALGADAGNLSSNPAGLGLFQRSEVSFTPGYGIGNTSSSVLGAGGSTSDSRNSLHVGNVGLIFTNRRPDSDNTSDWRAGSFGFGATRVNNFNSNFGYSTTVADQQSLFQRLREPRIGNGDGVNIDGNNSITDESKNGFVTLDGLAYGAYLTNPNFGGDGVETINRSGAIAQRESTQSSGSQTQYDLAYGASYRDKLYVGGGIGILSTRYDMTRDFYEVDAANSVDVYLRDQLQTRGTGFNARIGLIYRATDNVRVGASVQTPTWSRLTDSYISQLSTKFSPPLQELDDNGNPVKSISSGLAQTSTSPLTYTLTSPFRANAGAAVLLSKYGFLTGDIEFVNYSQARLRDEPAINGTRDRYPFSSENQAVRSLYQSAINLRFGGEARYDIFRFRLGYARYGDPFRNNDFDRTSNYYTVGLGMRQQSFFLDLAGVYLQNKQYYSPYELDDSSQPRVATDFNRFTTSITVGAIF